MNDTKRTEEDRQRYVSVAVSFRDEEALKRFGSGVAVLSCPDCGANGRRLGNPGEEMAFEGFTPVTKGGLVAILAVCHGCDKEVSLPHPRV